MTIKTLGSLLRGTPFYDPVRHTYHRLFNAKQYISYRSRLRLFEQIIQKHDLVFDVGANIGEYSEVFAALGAKVIAVEPDPRNILVLKKRFRKLVVIEECALGAGEGDGILTQATYGGVSTMSKEWVQATDAQWIGSIPVRMKTLDQLIQKHGVPAYVKIDVELYDDEVLRGLTGEPRLVSFEYQLKKPEVAERCVQRFPTREFNYVPNGFDRFALKSWCTADLVMEEIRHFSGGREYGDIFARTISPTLL